MAATSLAIIGLANIVGSLAAGALGNRVRMKLILFWMYASRAVAILLYLAAPKEPLDLLSVRRRAGRSPGWPPCRRPPG